MSETRKRKTTRLKELYNRKGKIVICLSAPTPHVAMLMEMAGFEYTYASGGATGSSMLGMPDNGTIGLMEFVWMAKLVGDAVNIPVACDVDACFGGIFHVERATTVDGIVLDHGRERIDFPRRRFCSDDIGVTQQDYRPLRPVAFQTRDDVCATRLVLEYLVLDSVLIEDLLEKPRCLNLIARRI